LFCLRADEASQFAKDEYIARRDAEVCRYLKPTPQGRFFMARFRDYGREGRELRDTLGMVIREPHVGAAGGGPSSRSTAGSPLPRMIRAIPQPARASNRRGREEPTRRLDCRHGRVRFCNGMTYN